MCSPIDRKRSRMSTTARSNSSNDVGPLLRTKRFPDRDCHPVYLPDKTAKCGSFATAQDSAPAINTRSRAGVAMNAHRSLKTLRGKINDVN